MEYRLIEGFPNYAVGDNRNVWSRKYGDWRKMSTKPCASGSRYCGVKLYFNNKRCGREVQRLVLEAFVSTYSDGHEATHINGNKEDNNLPSLAWKTPTENCRDKLIHGTQQRGEATNSTTLTPAKVQSIRRMCQAGIRQPFIARIFGVSRRTVSRVNSRHTWDHVA